MTEPTEKYPTKAPISQELLASLFNASWMLGDTAKQSEKIGARSFLDYSPAKPQHAPACEYKWYSNPGYITTEYRQPSFHELEVPRGTTIIDMNHSGQVSAAPGESARIATFGLGGCTGIGVVGIFPDGSRRAHVQHYDPLLGKRRDTSIAGSPEETILENEAHDGRYLDATQVTALLMLPERGYNQLENPAHAEWLSETIREQFGHNADIHVAPYAVGGSNDEQPYTRTLVIDIPAEGPVTMHAGLRKSFTIE